jgi:hypothetical protein
MPYEINETSNEVTFTYIYADLESIIKRLILMRSTTIRNKDGVPQIDIYSMNDSDSDFYDTMIINAANNLFNQLIKLTYGVTNVIFNEDSPAQDVMMDGVGDLYEGDESGSGSDSVIVPDTTPTPEIGTITFIIKYKTGYNTNYLIPIDNFIERYLKHSVQKQWYESCNLNEFAEAEQVELNVIVRKLLDGFVELRKAGLS